MKIIVKIKDNWVDLDLYKDEIEDTTCNEYFPDTITTTKPFFKVRYNEKYYFISPACIQFIGDEE